MWVGWVRNVSDGRVEATFEGKRENIEQMIEFCRIGPPDAQVTRTDVQWGKHTGAFNDFKILKNIIP